MSQLWKILKFLIINLIVVAALLGGFHFWLIAHAKNILADIVKTQSKGKYTLHVQKVKYNYLQLRLELFEPVLSSLDTSSDNDNFKMHSQRISLQLEKLWPLISGRELLIDSISMDRPFFDIMHQKVNNSQKLKTGFSLSGEMEKVYQSIQSVLTTLKVASFRINKGAFAVNFPLLKNSVPLQIRDIDFYIKGLQIDSSSNSQNPNSYTDDIQLRIAGQTIRFPESSKSIEFSSFRFIANTGSLEIDSCRMSGGDDDSSAATFNLFAEKMRIRNFHLGTNDSTDYNRIDSLFFTRPQVSFSIQIKEDRQDSSETIATAVNRITSIAFGKILIKYVSINNVDFDIEVERKEKISTFNFVQDSLVISNLGVGLYSSMPVSADNIRFGVKEFVDYFRDSTYIVHFDSVRINNNQFALYNFNIESTARVKKGRQKIAIPVLQLEGIDWFQLLTQKRLVASDFTFNDPVIFIVAAGDSKSKKFKNKNSKLDKVLREMFVIKRLAVHNGSVKYAFFGEGSLEVNKINTVLTSVDLSVPGSFAAAQNMIQQLKTGDLIYKRAGWKMTAQNLHYGKGNSFNASVIDLTNSERQVQIKANNVIVSGMSGEEKRNSLDIRQLSWEKATIFIDLPQLQQQAGKGSMVSLGAVNGGLTKLTLHGKGANVSAMISKLKTGNLSIEKGKPAEVDNLFVEGTSIDLRSENALLQIGHFLVNDKLPSFLTSVNGSFPLGKKYINVSIPRIDFETGIQETLSKHFNADGVTIFQPKIDISPSVLSASSTAQKPLPSIDLKNLEIKDPVILFRNNIEQEPIQAQSGQASLFAGRFQTNADSGTVRLENIKFQSENFSVNNKDSILVIAPGSTINFGVKAFTLYPIPSLVYGKWSVSDGSLDLHDINLLRKRSSVQKDSISVASLHLENLDIDEKKLSDPAGYLSSRPAVRLSNMNLEYKNNKSRLKFKGVNADTRSIALDSFSYHHQADVDAFMANEPYQKDYVSLNTGQVLVNNIDAAAWLKDSIFKVGHVTVTDAIFEDTRDKRLPFQADVIKELPVNLIKNIPFKTSIDSVNIINSIAVYNEISAKTDQTGSIRFDRLQASMRNIKNFAFQPEDYFRISASAYLMDTAFIHLTMKESYEDSLATFPFIIKARPFPLTLLNTFLLPTMNVKIKSGFADSLEIRGIGQEYLSVGEMRFFYHNLKVELTKEGNQQKKTLLTSLLTFAANNFVIKTNNHRRIGKIYYERSRNRSFFNYLVKMIASGGASSVGAKRNKKYNKLYKNKIKELNFQDIDL